MKISYNPTCTLHNATLEEDLKLCEESGFDFIELRIDKLKNYLRSHTREELQAFFRQSRMKPYAMIGIHAYKELFSPYDKEERHSAFLNEFRFGCEILCAVGASNMMIVPPLFKEEECREYTDSWEQRLEDNVRIFKELSGMAAAYSVNLGIKIIAAPRCSVRTINECNQIIDCVGRKNIGYTLDPFNFYHYERDNTFADMVHMYPDRLFVVHINGLEAEENAPLMQSSRSYPDRGNMNVENYLKRLEKHGYHGPVSVDFCRAELWEELPETVIRNAFYSTKKVMGQCGVLS